MLSLQRSESLYTHRAVWRAQAADGGGIRSWVWAIGFLFLAGGGAVRVHEGGQRSPARAGPGRGGIGGSWSWDRAVCVQGRGCCGSK